MTRITPPATVGRITAQGVDCLIAQDKAAQAHDEHAKAEARGGYVATVTALALAMGAAMPDDD